MRHAALEETLPRGLTAAEAAARLSTYGRNEIAVGRRRPPLLLRMLQPLSDPMAILLIAAAATYGVLGDRFDATVAGVALVPIVLVTLVLERRTQRALERLRRLTVPTATAIRDGEQTTIDAAEIVPGDVLIVREGDIVPAEGTLVAGSQLMLDESLLTGESQPVAKDVDATLGEPGLYAGTTLLSGRGMLHVTQTGPHTRHGSIGTLLAEIAEAPTPLQRVVQRFVKRLGAAALVCCVAIVGIELVRGFGWSTAVIAGVSLAMAAVPEEFPMVYTLYLALGAWRLARDNALIRRLASAETLGATTVICTDKTGTLTYGRLEVGAFVPADAGARILEAALAASESTPFDPLEQAIERYAQRAGIAPAEQSARLVRRYAFDPRGKYVSYVRAQGGSLRVYAKGAVEGILAHSRISDERRAGVERANRDLAAQGMRVIAVACGKLDRSQDRERDERALEFLGLIAFTDPVRPDVRASLEECRRAGIRVIMLTGDHPETARSVAASLGLSADGAARIATGDQIDRLDEAALADLAMHTDVFARVRPEQKYALVRGLQARGEVVAMTGDGTNDAPALREADIGIAMGKRGTEVAREASDLVLLDDDFTTIDRAVRDGRRIFDNLRHAFSYLLAFHVPLLLTALVLPLVGAPLLLLPIHLVWLELIVHPTSSLVFEADAPAPDLMRRPPRRQESGFFEGHAFWRPLLLGITLGATVLALYALALDEAIPIPEARALALTALIVGQLLLVLVEREPHAPLWRTNVVANPTLFLILGASLASLVAAIDVPALRAAVELAPLTLKEWAMAAALGAAATLWYEPLKRG